MKSEEIKLDWMKNLKPTDRTLTEIVDKQLEVTKQKYGRLLTEEEAVQLVDKVKEKLYERGELGWK